LQPRLGLKIQPKFLQNFKNYLAPRSKNGNPHNGYPQEEQTTVTTMLIKSFMFNFTDANNKLVRIPVPVKPFQPSQGSLTEGEGSEQLTSLYYLPFLQNKLP